MRDQTTVAQRTVSLDAAAHAVLSFVVPPTSGVLTANLDHDDALAADNQRTLVLPERPTVKVSLMYPAESRAEARARPGFLELALSAHPDVALVPESDASADIVVCHGCATPPAGGRNIVLVVPADRSGDAVPVLTVAPNHPLAAGLELDGVAAVARRGGNVGPSATVIAQAGGAPAIVASEIAGRRVVEIRLDPDIGPFPFTAAFPVVVANILEWLADDGRARERTAGEPVRLRLGSQTVRPQLVAPDGRVVETVFSEGVLTSSDTEAAGVYRVRTAAGEHVLAINPAVRGESNLAAPTFPPGSQAGSTVAPRRAVSDISTWLALAALGLLLLEWRYRVYGPLRMTAPTTWRVLHTTGRTVSEG
jgi:hypothetical protein